MTTARDVMVESIQVMHGAPGFAYHPSRSMRERAVSGIRSDLTEAGFAVVPVEPTEAMWGGLALTLVQWWSMGDRPTGKALYIHLSRLGVEPPQWLRDEIHDIDHVPSKGTFAACIFKAMLAAAQEVER